MSEERVEKFLPWMTLLADRLQETLDEIRNSGGPGSAFVLITAFEDPDDERQPMSMVSNLETSAEARDLVLEFMATTIAASGTIERGEEDPK